MAGRGYQRRVDAIRDGEPVAAAVANRPIVDLQGNYNYLRDRLDGLDGAAGACRRGATLDPAVLPGQPVYWNAGNQRFEPALADVEQDPASGYLVAAPSCDVVGIVLAKGGATLGDVLLAGYGTVDLAAATGEPGPAAPGRYYLSAAAPGMLTRQRPPVSVAVLVADGAGGVYVQPAPRDFLTEHVHYEFALVPAPAGGNGGTAVADPDPALPGWLPAADPSFRGLAPAGAAFGYNLAAEPALRRLWPPVPVASAQLFWDQGRDNVGGTLVPKGPGGLVVLDRAGIWWMSAAADTIPWPADWVPAGAPPPANPAAGPEDPRLGMRFYLTFARMLFATDKTVVTSLRPAAGSPLVFRDCDGNAAGTGDLLADLDLAFVQAPGLVDGGVVFKSLAGATFSSGWVVEGLRAGANCILRGTHVESKGSGAGAYALCQGEVTVDVLLNQGEIELAPRVERLADAQVRYHLDVPYIGFGPAAQSYLRLTFDVPATGLPALPQFAVRLRLLSRGVGSLPALLTTYRVIPRPIGGTPATLPGLAAELPLVLATAGIAAATDAVIEVTSSPITANPGDQVLVSIGRQGGDGFAAEIGVLRMDGVVTGQATS